MNFLKVAPDVSTLKEPSASARAAATMGLAFGRRLMRGHILEASLELQSFNRTFTSLLTGGVGTTRLEGLRRSPRVCMVPDRSTMKVMNNALFRLGHLVHESHPFYGDFAQTLSPLKILLMLAKKIDDLALVVPKSPAGAKLFKNRCASARWSMLQGLSSSSFPAGFSNNELRRVLDYLLIKEVADTRIKRRKEDLVRVSSWMENQVMSEHVSTDLVEEWRVLRAKWDLRVLTSLVEKNSSADASKISDPPRRRSL
jgi:hypothetical protein